MNSKLKVLLTADSYALPRMNPRTHEIELSYEQSYPLQLVDVLSKKTSREVVLINSSSHANVTLSLIKGGLADILLLEPEYVIVQLGMADLWPGTNNRRAMFDELNGADPWIDISSFQKNIERYIDFCQQENYIKKIILVNIPLAEKKQYKHYPAAESRTLDYNACFQKWQQQDKVKVVDLYQMVQDIGTEHAIGSDGIHPTEKTCRYLAKELATYIDY